MENVGCKIYRQYCNNFRNHVDDDFCNNITHELYYNIWVPIGSIINNQINNEIYRNIEIFIPDKFKYD